MTAAEHASREAAAMAARVAATVRAEVEAFVGRPRDAERNLPSHPERSIFCRMLIRTT